MTKVRYYMGDVAGESLDAEYTSRDKADAAIAAIAKRWGWIGIVVA